MHDLLKVWRLGFCAWWPRAIAVSTKLAFVGIKIKFPSHARPLTDVPSRMATVDPDPKTTSATKTDPSEVIFFH